MLSTNNAEADPLLSSFICNAAVNLEPPSAEPDSADVSCSVVDGLVEDSSERYEQCD